MGELRVIKVKQSVLANNDLRAAKLRGELKEKGVFFLNVMSSPGSGKTTLLCNLINRLKDKIRIGVIEADMDAVVDADTVAKRTGVRTIQLNTSGECHLDAKMTSEGIAELGTEGIDLVILENIGNLVCPAEFDTGATMNLVLLSVPEGDDKPLKYPLMFTKGNAFVFTKIDARVVFDFDVEKAEKRIRNLNPDAVFFPVSAKTEEGMDELAAFLLAKIADYQKR
ncbi:MAG: hydrogenase nickel incorporation protein HypB [Erysipelotrichaceae bacterium]|nr:hydrogenase nickel incorporation protein HypB [Erysipelotrichaceae bacterium]